MTRTIVRAAIARLRADTRGNTVIEFAIVAPVMLTLMMGLGDLLYQSYTQSILDGAIQKAGRDSAIQGGAQQTAVLDGKVIDMVKRIAKNATWTSKRETYASYSAMAPERFTDTNGNGVRNAGECFDDINGNGQWDANPSRSGQGGANDVTMYTVTVTYPRIFPVAGLLGFSPTNVITARTLLKNQPYASQTAQTTVSICT